MTETAMPIAPAEVGEGFVDIDGDSFYAIPDVDEMPPFLMSIVSDSDHWMFVSSRGGLTAGTLRRGRQIDPAEDLGPGRLRFRLLLRLFLGRLRSRLGGNGLLCSRYFGRGLSGRFDGRLLGGRGGFRFPGFFGGRSRLGRGFCSRLGSFRLRLFLDDGLATATDRGPVSRGGPPAGLPTGLRPRRRSLGGAGLCQHRCRSRS